MDAVEIAGVFALRFRERFQADIDEMKLHKMLYLAQRESLILTHKPLFANEIYAWQYGPVVRDVREAIRNNGLPGNVGGLVIPNVEKECIDSVFDKYSGKTSWSLSRLTHAEYSWRHAREMTTSGGGHRVISIRDIAKDAERVRKRREALRSIGLT